MERRLESPTSHRIAAAEAAAAAAAAAAVEQQSPQPYPHIPKRSSSCNADTAAQTKFQTRNNYKQKKQLQNHKTYEMTRKQTSTYRTSGSVSVRVDRSKKCISRMAISVGDSLFSVIEGPA
jgi:hypothetical protein